MVPMISEISIDGDSIDEQLKRGNVYIVSLTQQLFDIVEKRTVITRGSDPLVEYLDLGPTRDLVHIDSFMDRKCDRIMPLIRRHSTQTLQSLRINVGFRANLVGLIKDPGSGKFLEYPRLHTLKISQFSSSYASQRSVFPDAVPFPHLRHLNILHRYPFADDVLFRGNAATLEYLRVSPYPKTMSILATYNVFTPTSHPKLDSVIIGMLSYESVDEFDNILAHIVFSLSIGPGASVRVVSDLHRLDRVVTTLPSLIFGHTSLQVLILPQMHLLLWEAMMLVCQLPLLSDLETDTPTLGGISQGLTMADILALAHLTCTSVGRRFRCWHIECNQYAKVDYAEVATCKLLMALDCPNFAYAAIHSDRPEPFMKAMEEKINEPRFSQDAPRLHRLLFNGSKAC
ncbi:hypothetical protein H4R27_002403 [Coemansia aciculifera]|nr:hypothetical protein H4R27_002403 [Coemansia aciculifera]